MQLVNAMTVDVEDYFHVSAFANHVSRDDWATMTPRVGRNTHELLELFAARNVRATFFVLGWVAEREPNLIREIAAAGHEVACHGFSHKLVYEQTPSEFKAETLRAKTCLEQIVQRPIRGYRAASYSIVKSSLWALDTLVELGFEYDSSIFPVHHDRYGIPNAPHVPHVIEAPSGGRLIEFPLSTLAGPGLRLPIAGGGYFRLFPYRFTRWALRRINERERIPFIFYLHPWEVDPDQPRVAADWLGRFRHYQGLDRCRGRMERLLGDFTFDTVQSVLRNLRLLGSPSPQASNAAQYVS